MCSFSYSQRWITCHHLLPCAAILQWWCNQNQSAHLERHRVSTYLSGLVFGVWPLTSLWRSREKGRWHYGGCWWKPLCCMEMLDNWSLSSQDRGNFRPHGTNKSAIIPLLLKLRCPGVILIPPRLTCSVSCNFWLARVASVLQGP